MGTLQPRKNIGTLIAAHRLLAPQLRQDIPLVVVGKAGWGCEDVMAQLTHGDGGALRWLRYVPDADMLPLLHQASALVFPSLHEGFGLPVLEAFAARTPVISANTTALAEIAPGGGALMVNPHSSGELARPCATWPRRPRHKCNNCKTKALPGRKNSPGKPRSKAPWSRTNNS